MDEHISSVVAAALRRRGIDVTTSSDTGLLAAPDLAHLAFAAEARRVLVTQDADFLRLHSSGVTHAGIIYCQQDSRSLREILAFLLLLRDVLTADEMRNRVEFV